MRDDKGELVTDFDGIQRMLVTHFSNLFDGTEISFDVSGRSTVEDNQSEVVASLLNGLDIKLTDEQIRDLEVPFTEGEVHEAVFQMKGSKAPGPDGFVARFCQRNWHLVVTMLLRWFWRSCILA